MLFYKALPYCSSGGKLQKTELNIFRLYERNG